MTDAQQQTVIVDGGWLAIALTFIQSVLVILSPRAAGRTDGRTEDISWLVVVGRPASENIPTHGREPAREEDMMRVFY